MLNTHRNNIIVMTQEVMCVHVDLCMRVFMCQVLKRWVFQMMPPDVLMKSGGRKKGRMRGRGGVNSLFLQIKVRSEEVGEEKRGAEDMIEDRVKRRKGQRRKKE